MPTITSLDPRITRASIPAEQEQPFEPKETMDQFQTFEVFVQSKTGGHHAHAGSVHAPTPEMAMSYAKEQYDLDQQPRQKSSVAIFWQLPHSVYCVHLQT